MHLHAKVKHGTVNPVLKYLSSGVCPACGMDFSTRARLVKHLGDRRRPKCRERVLSGAFPEVSSETQERLSQEDTLARRSARRAGRTSVFADAPAVDCRGRVRGRVFTAPPRI